MPCQCGQIVLSNLARYICSSNLLELIIYRAIVFMQQDLFQNNVTEKKIKSNSLI